MKQLVLQDFANVVVQHSLTPKCPLYVKIGNDMPVPVIGVEPMLNDEEEVVGFILVANPPEAF